MLLEMSIHSDFTLLWQALHYWNAYLHPVDAAHICTDSNPSLSHKVMYGGFPSLTPASTVIRINNSRLINLVFLCGMILFVGGKAWSQMFIPALSAASEVFCEPLEGKLCFRPSGCVSTCGLTEKLKRAEYNHLMSRDLCFLHLQHQ